MRRSLCAPCEQEPWFAVISPSFLSRMFVLWFHQTIVLIFLLCGLVWLQCMWNVCGNDSWYILGDWWWINKGIMRIRDKKVWRNYILYVWCVVWQTNSFSHHMTSFEQCEKWCKYYAKNDANRMRKNIAMWNEVMWEQYEQNSLCDLEAMLKYFC